MILNNFKKKFFLKINQYYKYLFIFILILNTNIISYDYNIKKKKDLYCINKIIFFGINKIKLKNFITNINSYKKKCMSEKDISNIMNTLFLTNMFNNIDIFRYKNLIFIKILEKPIINNILIKGNKIIYNNFINLLLKKFNIKKGEILNNVLLFYFKKNIEYVFLKNGMFTSKVKIKITTDINNRANIQILFKEHDITKINEINIIGNNNYTTNFLLNYLKINNHFFFKKETYQINFIIDILIKLKNFYFNRGYINFKIKNITQYLSFNKKKLNLIITIQENKKFFYKKIILNINKKKYYKNIKNIINITPGNIYNNSVVIQSRYKIKQFMNNHGFLNNKIKIKKIFNNKNNTIDLIFDIKTQKKFYVRKIDFLGNNFTHDYILRNQVLQMEGTYINVELLKKTQKKLYSLGYFDKVEIFLHKNHDLANTIDIIFKVKEKNIGFLNTNLGMGMGGSLSLDTNIKQNNFIGTGYDVDINFNKDFYHYYLEFFVMKNNVFLNQVNIGIKIFINKLKENNNFFYDYINKNKGIIGIIKFPINNNIFLESNFGFIKNQINNIKPQISLWRYFKSIGYKKYNKLYKHYLLDEFIIQYSFFHNNLNNFQFPFNGNLISIDTDFTAPVYINTGNYKIDFNYLQYFPLNLKFLHNSLVFLFKSNIGYGNSFFGEYPFYKNFLLGGANSIRGFKNNSIGPKAVYYSSKEHYCNNKKTICLSDNSIGGNFLININNELIMPVPFIKDKYKKEIKSSIFLDIGNLVDTSWKNDYLSKLYKIPKFSTFTKIKASIGFSLKWYSRFGKITLSYAYPLKMEKTDKIEFFQFSISKIW
ncbi:outer membrane protein assembly factor BamA [Enterobacteriaceae endosymbiont of Donacia semicuprea]|uniref:outer membrane protein assembly factor BamA n=1 Tax=Enterobacteriaceae endosymbiont of Donacia semicuprea TaxID=2675783 RepID=UPI0014490ED3|nr:outer membrane protein assembly factor BamA [Enterobacteriaceae endosymbiont of Donacia semicuprea]QJC32891.1 outer membrane protein assembly factor BamA [Enterobacteriaceae endosymbiont of Donacia semicuprea]